MIKVKKNYSIPNRAGADIGSEKIFISPDGEQCESFSTTTEGLKRAMVYLKSFGIDSVAMEATGVYWMNFYDFCEKEGFDVWLVNPKYTKTRAGRKTDPQDCMWIQKLHSSDLLEKSFIPGLVIRELREYVRIRESYIESKSKRVNQMHKALIQMNLRLDTVLSQVHGASGMKMIKAILAGERDAQALLNLCDIRIKKTKADQVIAALQGNYQVQYLFALQIALDDYYVYEQRIVTCDKQIEQQLKKMSAHLEKPKKISKPKPIRHNKPQIDDFQELMQTLFGGKDLTSLPGFTNYSLLRVMAEIGTNVDPWPTKKHFTSWLNLAPQKHESGKYRKKKNRNRKSHRVGLIFRQLAQSLIKSKKIALGQFGRRLRYRHGPQVAIKALARKLAELYYMALSKGLDYVEKGVATYQKDYEKGKVKQLMDKAKKMGFQLINVDGEILNHSTLKSYENVS